MAQPIPDPPASTPVPERRSRYIGQPFRRVDGRAKVTGRTLFADDLVFPRMAHMKLVRSTRPHARIRGHDLSRAYSAS
jgi:CO/xanthine dehydrogenase Mo-binding subunit